jgi:hypothetical protein
MSDEVQEHEIRERAYKLWQDAGSPEGQENEFWEKAKDQITKEKDNINADTASEDSFPASDPVNHM